MRRKTPSCICMLHQCIQRRANRTNSPSRFHLQSCEPGFEGHGIHPRANAAQSLNFVNLRQAQAIKPKRAESKTIKSVRQVRHQPFLCGTLNRRPLFSYNMNNMTTSDNLFMLAMSSFQIIFSCRPCLAVVVVRQPHPYPGDNTEGGEQGTAHCGTIMHAPGDARQRVPTRLDIHSCLDMRRAV
jgi:hypothetical protein